MDDYSNQRHTTVQVVKNVVREGEITTLIYR